MGFKEGISEYVYKLRDAIKDTSPETVIKALKKFNYSAENDREVLEFILKDFSLIYSTDNYKSLKELMDKELQFNSEEKVGKYARASEFENQKVITVLDFKRLKATETGSKYADKWGMTNLLTFKEGETERKLDDYHYGFYLGYKSSGLKSGDQAIVFSVLLQDPKEGGHSYRHWVFQKI